MPKVEKYIEKKRVRGTDFITGTDKDGNVVRFSGAFFISTIVNESNYLSLVLDEQEARIAADELLDDKISVLGEQLGTRISQNESGLTQLGADIHNELYGPGGITESYTSAITQTAQSISSSVDAKLYGPDGIEESYSSLIHQTASSITSSVDGKLYGPDGIEASYTSMIQQTADSIALSVDAKLYGPDGIEESYSSLIQQTAQSIVLSVESELYGPDGIQQKYTSALQLFSDQIILTVDGTLNDFENEVYTEVGSIIQQSATDILLQVDGKIVDVKGEITTEYTSAITIAKDEISLAVNGQLTDLETDITSAYQSAIVVAKDEIGLSVSGQLTTLEGEITSAYESAITISEGEILSTVGTQITGLDGRIATNSSSITQLSNSIDLSVFTNGVLDAGILIGKINDSTSGVRITGKSILLDGNVEITGTAFAENIYASGATIGGFIINEASLQLGTQAAWNPSSGTEGLLMGVDPLDSKYKFYLGDVENHLIWNGENLIISGFALIGDGSSTTTLNDLGKLEGYFEIVNEGQANEYLKLLAPLAVTGEVQAWASDPNIFPPNIWSSLPLASDTTLGAVRIGAGLSYNAVTGMISVDGSVGTGFDESSNYSPSGTWAFTGAVSVGGSPVATQAYAQPVITGGASTITSSNLTASRALISNASGKVAVSAVTSTELGYLDGVTSDIQAQLNGKAALAGSSTQNFTVKDLYIHGTVNHWLADVITVDDAKLQLNRTQNSATVVSGLDIWNGTSVVSSLNYTIAGNWQFTQGEIYQGANKVALQNVSVNAGNGLSGGGTIGANRTITLGTPSTISATSTNSVTASSHTHNLDLTAATANNALNLGGYSAASYPRKAENATVTGNWIFGEKSASGPDNPFIDIRYGYTSEAKNRSASIIMGRGTDVYGSERYQIGVFADNAWGDATHFHIKQGTGVGQYTSRLTILKTSGFTGIGITTPQERLHVAGNGLFTGDIKLPTGGIDIGTRNGDGLRFRNSDNFKIYFSQSSDATLGGNLAGTADFNMYFKTLGANRGWAFKYDNNVVAQIQGNGSFSVTGAVTAGGNITAQGEVTAYQSSDKRLKSNITPITSSLSIIDKLNPVSFQWNDKAVELNNTKNTSSRNYGVIAQELEEVLPDLVHQTNGFKSVDYIQLIGVLLAGMKELNNKIKNLENR